MVFDLGKTVMKIYHHPTARHADKLRALLPLAKRLPPNVLGPRALATNPAGEVVGYEMPKLPPGTRPFKQFASLRDCQAHGYTLAHAVVRLRQAHAALQQIHAAGFIVGDLNDGNLFFHPQQLGVWWVDVDSYQFGPHPCPVAMLTFLDPRLYGTPDFAARPCFTADTDWYAFTTLAVKTLLHAHPYGGAHPAHKTLRARGSAGISILHPDVRYPPRARPLQTLSAGLRQHLHAVYERGRRGHFPLRLLNGLTPARPCPQPAAPRTRTLFEAEGIIVHLAAQHTGRILAVARRGTEYTLIRAGVGGKTGAQTLFTGEAGYRFASFGDCLVVSPAGQPGLLVLDISAAPRQVAMLQTGLYRGTPAFAATPRHLYRLAGSYLLRGRVQNGLWVEETIATVHPNQTEIWTSPHSEALAGHYRVFGEHGFFTLTPENGQRDVDLPPLLPGESLVEAGAAFSETAAAFLLKIARGGERFARYCRVSLATGALLEAAEHPATGIHASPHGKALTQRALLHPADDQHHADGLVPHPNGLLAHTGGYVNFVQYQSSIHL